MQLFAGANQGPKVTVAGPFGGGGVSYYDQDVCDALQIKSGRLVRSWRFCLLTQNGVTWKYKADLTPWITRATISHDTTRAVKRTCEMVMAETSSVITVDLNNQQYGQTQFDYYRDWVQVVYRLGMPDGGYLEYCLGTFCVTNPQELMTSSLMQRTVQLADLTYTISRMEGIAADATDSTGKPIVSPYAQPIVIPEGTGVMSAILKMLTNSYAPNPGKSYDSSSVSSALATLPGVGLDPTWLDHTIFDDSRSEWSSALIPAGGFQIAPGSSYLDAINQLLYSINVYQIYATAGALCPQNTATGLIGTGQGDQYTMSGHHTTSNGPVLSANRWPAYQNYAGVTPGYAYTSDHGTAHQVIVQKNDGSVPTTYGGASANGGLTFQYSVVMPGTQETLDMSGAANVVNVIIEDTSAAAVSFAYVNTNPNSPLSKAAGFGRTMTKVVQLSGIPANNVQSGAYSWAAGIAMYEMMLATGGVDQVSLVTAVNPLHEDHDVIALNLTTPYIQDGTLQNQVLVIGEAPGQSGTILPGITLSQNFLETAWQIDISLPTPGSGNDAVTTGLTTAIEARQTAPGAVMTHSLMRVTNITPDWNGSNGQGTLTPPGSPVPGY
jgi:hypothetical protein